MSAETHLIGSLALYAGNSAEVRVRNEPWSPADTMNVTGTGNTRGAHDTINARLRAVALPFALMGAWLGPGPLDGTRRYRSSTATTSSPGIILGYLAPADEWVYEPQLVTAAQVESLTELLALPWGGDFDFDYRADDHDD
ncbi:MAG: hypothetical protein M3Q31_05625 [Actinomycetota bacterium]|nr:hypothetical protein [Actinomycetota bacterium]